MAASHQGSAPALADATTYNSTRRQIRAAILTSSAINVSGAGGKLSPENPDPHIFYVMDSRTDLKPLGMDFINPLAPPVITNTIYQRWLDRVRIANSDPAFVAGTPESQIFRIGAPITKNIGAYWELNLDSASDEDLRHYDVLYLHSHRQKAIFSPDQKEKLRKYVEAGGTLWVENCGSFTFDSQNPFLYDVSMQADYTVAGGASAVIGNASHPLLTYPYVLGAQDVQNLGDKYRVDNQSGGRFLLPGYYLYTTRKSTDPAPGPDIVNPPGGQTLVPIVWNSRGVIAGNASAPPASWRPLILAGQVGAGRIVFASQDTGCTINDQVGGASVGYGGNSGAISGNVISAASPNDLKFAYNLAAWTGAHTTTLGNSRHTGSTSEKIAGALTEKWPYPEVGGTAVSVGGATFFKHCVYTVDSNLVLHCYDAKPQQDLDGDGNPDDGLPDSIYAYPFDEIWNFNLKSISNSATAASTPTCYEFYDPGHTGVSNGLQNFTNREQVVVVLSDGKVVALRALPRVSTSGFPLAPIGQGPFGAPNNNNAIVEWVADTSSVTSLTDFPTPPSTSILVPAATWSEGVLFVTVNTNGGGATSGRVVAIDPRSVGTAKSAFNPLAGTNANGLDSQAPIQAGGNTPPPFVGSPTIGYVRDNVSGALDKIIYVHADKTTSNVGQTIVAIPFGTKGEQLTRSGATTTFLSRSTGTATQLVSGGGPSPIAWFRADPNNPGNSSLALGQRVYATYTDPTTGTFYSTELTFSGMGATTPGPNNEYAAPQPTVAKQAQQVIISGSITFPANGSSSIPAIAGTDSNLKVYADYTLDWTLDAGSPLDKTTWRTRMTIPDANPPGNTFLGGPPALSDNDILYYTVDTSGLGTTTLGKGALFAVSEQAAARSTVRWSYLMHDNVPIAVNGNTTLVPPRLRQLDPATPLLGDYIYNVQYVGTPAERNGILYVSAVGELSQTGGTPVSIVLAFKANPEFVIHLNTPIDKAQQVRLAQFNPLKMNQGNPTKEFFPLSPALPNQKSNFDIDYDSGTIRLNAMSLMGQFGSYLNASMPMIVAVGNQEVLVAGKQTDVIGGVQETRMIGPAGVDNLLWYAVIPAQAPAPSSPFKSPGLISSPPSIQGDTLFVGTSAGFVIAMDADPGATDAAAQAVGAQIQLVDATGKLVHLRWVQQVNNLGAPVRSAPVASENVLIANTLAGAHAYEDALTIIADGNRLIEVNSAGDAVWTCEGTRSFGAAGGDLSQYIDNGGGSIIPINPQAATGVPVVHKIPFARPSVARRIGTNDFLVVDTGNNRVVQVDRGGNIIWEVHRLFDDMSSLLRPGDPLSLNEPSDCSYWTEYTPNMDSWFAANNLPYTYNNLPGYIVHYLITDTGNYRVIELVDVYNSAGQPVRPNSNGNPASFTLLRQLFFASSTFGSEGKKYRYRGVQRSLQINGTLKGTAFYDATKPDNATRRFTLTAISNYRLGSGSNTPSGTSDAVSGGGGSIVVLDETGAPLSVVTNLAIPNGVNSYKLQPINNPTSFSKFDEYSVALNTTVFHYLLTDANGAYQLRSGVDANNNPVMIVEWMLSNDDYFAATGKRLNAMSIRRLNTAVVSGPNQGMHNFLIANRFSGGDLVTKVFGITQNVQKDGEFNGEVFEISPQTYDVTVPFHGYVPDFSVNMANFLVPNTGGSVPQASIVWRAPSQTVPLQVTTNGTVIRFIGSPTRATSTGILDKPSYADRPF